MIYPNYIKMAPMAGLTGLGGGPTGLLVVGAAGAATCTPDGSTFMGARGLFMGGTTGSQSNVIDYIGIGSTGDATDFGDLTSARAYGAACSDGCRAVYGGGNHTPYTNILDYVAIPTADDATDFGDLTAARQGLAAVSNGSRGCWSGGVKQPSETVTNIIDYVAIATTGDASDFGDMNQARYGLAGASNGTRGIFAMGATTTSGGGGDTLNIDYITIGSTGDASDFGDLSGTARRTGSACSNSSGRAVIGGGWTSAKDNTDTMDYVSIASTGDATDFGDLATARREICAVSNGTRGVWGSGKTGTGGGSAVSNVMEYVTISSTGDASDFGDLTVSRSYPGGASGADS